MWRMRITCWITEATNTHTEYVTLLLFYCKNGCMNASQYYIICTLPALSGHTEKYSNISFHENLPSESHVAAHRQIDRQTDRPQ